LGKNEWSFDVDRKAFDQNIIGGVLQIDDFIGTACLFCDFYRLRTTRTLHWFSGHLANLAFIKYSAYGRYFIATEMYIECKAGVGSQHQQRQKQRSAFPEIHDAKLSKICEQRVYEMLFFADALS
jgi:hypothetical protein